MKYIFSLVILISFTYPNLLSFVNFNEAIKYSTDDDKIIMVMYGQDDCYACQKMDDETFENTDLVYFIEENFHSVYINISHNKKLRGLPARGTPTFYFLTKNKTVLKQAIGAINAKSFRKVLSDALKKHMKN